MLRWADLEALPVWAHDEGPHARRNGHAGGIMRDVMGACLALFMEGVVRCWHLQSMHVMSASDILQQSLQ